MSMVQMVARAPNGILPDALEEIEKHWNENPLIFPSGPTSKYALLSKETKLQAWCRTAYGVDLANVPVIHQYSGYGVVLFADLSGYTDLSSKLAQTVKEEAANAAQKKDNHDAQEKSNDHATVGPVTICLLGNTAEFAGVMEFAGDMVICIWKVAEDGIDQLPALYRPTTQDERTLLAKAAAREMQIKTMDIAEALGLNGRLLLHGGIGVGSLLYFDLSYGDGNRWNLVHGSAFTEAKSNMQPLEIGFRVDKKREKVDDDSVTKEMIAEALVLVGQIPEFGASEWAKHLSEEHVDAYVPRHVLSFLKGPGENQYTGRVMTGCVMFISCKEVFKLSLEDMKNKRISEARLNSWETLFQVMMRTITENGGDIVNFLYGEKGVTLIALFLERVPLAGAIKIAAMTVKDSDEKDKRVKVALSLGEMYHGCIGTTRDRWFLNVLSETVTLAGRMLGKVGLGQVVVSESVYQLIPKKRREKMRYSNKKSFETFTSMGFRRSVLKREDRFENFQYHVLSDTEGYRNDLADLDLEKVEEIPLLQKLYREVQYRPLVINHSDKTKIF